MGRSFQVLVLLILIIKDTKAKTSLAKKATKELVEQNVDIILGPFFSSSLNASLKIAKYKNIPLISFSSDKKQKEEGVYLMGFEPEIQITNITCLLYTSPSPRD